MTMAVRIVDLSFPAVRPCIGRAIASEGESSGCHEDYRSNRLRFGRIDSTRAGRRGCLFLNLFAFRHVVCPCCLGVSPGQARPDASQTFGDNARLRVFQVGYICCTFARQYAFTEFVAPTTFTASHIILPLRFVSDAGGQNVAFLVERYDPLGGTWSNARPDSRATVRGSQVGPAVSEVELPFGTNATAN